MGDYLSFYSHFFGFFISLIACILIFLTKDKHYYQVNIDKNPQKIHTDYVPRIGGLSIILGIASHFFLLDSNNSEFYLNLFLVSCVVFLIGFVEDLRQDLNPIFRLFLCFCASSVLFIFLFVRITHVNIDIIDEFLLNKFVSYFLQ